MVESVSEFSNLFGKLDRVENLINCKGHWKRLSRRTFYKSPSALDNSWFSPKLIEPFSSLA